MATDLNLVTYPFDPTGRSAPNKITGEQQILTGSNFRDYNFIVPKLAPYFAESLVIRFRATDNSVRTLVEGIDYYPTHWFISASRACAKDVYGSITFLNTLLTGVVTLEYQTIGGIWTQDDAKLAEILADKLHNPRITSWDVVVDMPISFPVINHEWDLADMVGGTEVVAALAGIETALRQTGQTGITDHIANHDNPHAVTAEQVGLGLVRNLGTSDTATAQAGTSDDVYMTPKSTAAAVTSQAVTPLNLHKNNLGNPHNTTAAQVGAYSFAQTDTLLAQKVSFGQAASDSLKLDAMSSIQLRDWVLEGTAANSLQFNGLNYSDLLAAVLAGKTADSYKLDGRTFSQVVDAVQAISSSNATTFDSKTYAQAKADILTGKAADSTLLDGRTYAQAKADILLGVASDSTHLEGRTFTQVKNEVLTGKAADSTLFDGRTYDQIIDTISGISIDNTYHFNGYTYSEAKADILAGTAANATLLNGHTYQSILDTIAAATVDSATHFGGFTYAQAKADILAGKAADSFALEGFNLSAVVAQARAGKVADSTLFDGRTFAQAKAEVLTGKAADSALLDGFTYAQVVAASQAATSANATLFDNKDYPTVKADILSGTAANATTFDGRTTAQLKSYLDGFYTGGDNSISQITIPADTQADPVAFPNVWQAVASVSGVFTVNAVTQDKFWLITGGESDTDLNSGCYLVRASFRSSTLGQLDPRVVVTVLGDQDTGLQFALKQDSISDDCVLWVRASSNCKPMTVARLSSEGSTLANVGSLVPLYGEPSGLAFGPATGRSLASAIEQAVQAAITAYDQTTAAATRAELTTLQTDVTTAIETLTTAFDDLRVSLGV